MLYADTYLSEEEFHQMFDHTLYNKVCWPSPLLYHFKPLLLLLIVFTKVRSKYMLEQGFPTIYSKVCKANRH
jgi:hypothetical protein